MQELACGIGIIHQIPILILMEVLVYWNWMDAPVTWFPTPDVSLIFCGLGTCTCRPVPQGQGSSTSSLLYRALILTVFFFFCLKNIGLLSYLHLFYIIITYQCRKKYLFRRIDRLINYVIDGNQIIKDFFN